MSRESFEPHVFGHYYLLEHIAYGGMAEIYRAKSFGASGFERELVLKRVLKKLTDNPSFLEMLVNEAKLTATLQHGNIAQVFELGLHQGIYFITMEYVEGVSLKDLIRAMRKQGELIPPREAAFIISQMCYGLHYAHQKTDPMGKPLSIVHCDVSPDNVIIGFDGTVKVVDFGIARAQASFSNYKEGMVMGKFNYVSPEQAMGKALDCRADVFSTGIVLYELLTGGHPFGRKGDVDTLIRIAKFAKGEVQPPVAKNPDVPSELSEICMTAMGHTPKDRYQTARDFAAALLQYLQPMTAAQAHQVVTDRLQSMFADRLAERRQVRARDDEVIRGLQRAIATHADEEEDEDTSGGRAALGGAARVPAWQRVVLPAAGAVVGLLLGLLLGRVAAPEPAPILFVDSEPRGATVLLERQPRGQTPLVLEIESDRPYLLQVELEGHTPFEETFSPQGRLETRAPKLAARLAPLSVESQPDGAEVSIDGTVRGKTPLAVDLAVGSEVLVTVEWGGRSEEKRVRVEEEGSLLRFVFDGGRPRSR